MFLKSGKLAPHYFEFTQKHFDELWKRVCSYFLTIDFYREDVVEKMETGDSQVCLVDCFSMPTKEQFRVVKDA